MLGFESSVSEVASAGGLASATQATSKVQGPGEAQGVGQSFAAVMGAMASGALEAVKTGEAMSTLGVQGKVSIQEVVPAVMEAERALQAALAIRDKVAQAYLELSRMGI